MLYDRPQAIDLAAWLAAALATASHELRSPRDLTGLQHERPLQAPGWPARWLAQQRAARLGGQPIDAGASGKEEDAPILTPGQVGGQLRQGYAS